MILEGQTQTWRVEIPAIQSQEALSKLCSVLGASCLSATRGRSVRVMVSEDGRISDIGHVIDDLWLGNSDCLSLEMDPKNEP